MLEWRNAGIRLGGLRVPLAILPAECESTSSGPGESCRPSRWGASKMMFGIENSVGYLVRISNFQCMLSRGSFVGTGVKGAG